MGEVVMNVFKSSEDPSPLNGGGGGGTSGGMLERVVKLEANVESLKRDVTDLRGDMKDVRDRMARLEVKVDHLPSKGFIVGALMTGLAALTAVTLFQDRIISLFG